MNSPAGGLWGLRQMVKTRPAAETCDLCGEALGESHPHMLNPEKRQVLCACQACTLLLGKNSGNRFRQIPERAHLLQNCRITEQQWLTLGIPINLAFLVRQSTTGEMTGLYPSPAGITESSILEEVWADILRNEPRLAQLQDDVQALLVNRVHQPYEHYIAPIDHCYRLAGLIRLHWKGFSGGTEVWKQIAAFFEDMRKRAETNAGAQHA